ncbi:MAG: Protoporphyrinogen and coproporphyrinogen oxidase [Acidobacteria bacterium]|nr:Protoporphyrinogen and coproporphyrinogen oxidase [Acidobacteriota bacterium]
MQVQRQPKRIVIIGGGITGLAAAHRLLELTKSDQPLEVLLLEGSSRVGGVLKTTERDGFLIEAGADSFISDKPEAIALAHRLGISSRLIETNENHRRSFIVRKGRLRPVPDGFQLLAPTRFWPFVTTDIFSWPGKARMALDLIIPKRAANGDDDESLAEFVRRRLGREAFERMAQPMIGGIYTADPEKLSLRATLPRFLDMEKNHGSVIRAMWKQRRNTTLVSGAMGKKSSSAETGVSGPRYSLFLSFDRGMQVLVDELSARVQDQIRLNTRAESLSLSECGTTWNIRLTDRTSIEADFVCLAIPAYAAAALLQETDAELSHLLNQIEYASTATINLAYRRVDIPHALDGFGFVVPFIESRSILACTFSSVKFAGRAPEEHVLLRAFLGGALQPHLFELGEDEMLRRVREDLRDLLGLVKPPLFSVVQKWRRSMPQYHVGHLDLVSRIRARAQTLPGLHLAGNSYGGAGVPDCIRSGEAAAEKALAPNQ